MLFFEVEDKKLNESVNTKFFATLYLDNAIPNETMVLLKREFDQKMEQYKISGKNENQRNRIKKVFFSRFDSLLDKYINGPNWLVEDDIAKLVMDRLWENHGDLLDLICYTIMPNHIHLLCEYNFPGIENIQVQWDDFLAELKNDIAKQANKVLMHDYKFWNNVNYNHQVNDENEMINIISYIVENPVKAGLVEYWKDWPFTFVNSKHIQ